MGGYKCHDGYKLEQQVDNNDSEGGLESGMIMPKSSRIDFLWAIPPGLFLDFINREPTAEGMLGFCNQYGPLTTERGETRPIAVAAMLSEHAKFRNAWGAFKSGDEQLLTKVLADDEPVRCEVLLLPEAITRISYCMVWPGEQRGGAQLAFVPPTIREAMWLQFAEFVRSKAEILYCENCGRPFIAGSGTRRRHSAKWCTPRCKSVAHGAKRRERLGETERSA